MMQLARDEGIGRRNAEVSQQVRPFRWIYLGVILDYDEGRPRRRRKPNGQPPIGT
jgi:hypothetical protein